jgi:hypothetical protein
MKIQFVGTAGITQSCIKAVLRYLQFGDQLLKVLIITSEQRHALILYTEYDEIIAVKSGFSSGYIGEGPRGLACILLLLHEKGIEIEEYNVKRTILEKINSSHLSESDLNKIESSDPVGALRWHEYIYDYMEHYSDKENLLNRFPAVIPFSIIDSRLFDLSMSFWDAPDDKIFTGYKRLEEAIRNRCKLDEHGSSLFKKAFLGDNSILSWPNLTSGEAVGRANLFIAMYGGFRNRRAHKEIEDDPKSVLAEFLTLNQLFRLEALSKARE